jgi:protoheme IX farnesyltransferase
MTERDFPRVETAAATPLVESTLLAGLAGRLADYLELAKARIVVLELIVAAASASIAARHALDVPVVLWALLGTALVAASASVANQWLERGVDARMRRTAARPLPAGRVASQEAVLLSAIMLGLGVWTLGMRVNALTCLLGVASWLLYVAVYTPLKSRSTLNTAVGAVAGAIPILMGWTATGAPLTIVAWSLAVVLYLWQFPHFMAIAWLHRTDYARAGHRMTSVADPTGLRAAALAVLGAALVVPVSLAPAVLPTSGSPWVYSLWSVALGGLQFALAVHFALCRDEASARRLLRATLIYLPAWLAMLVVVAA